MLPYYHNSLYDKFYDLKLKTSILLDLLFLYVSNEEQDNHNVNVGTECGDAGKKVSWQTKA